MWISQYLLPDLRIHFKNSISESELFHFTVIVVHKQENTIMEIMYHIGPSLTLACFDADFSSPLHKVAAIYTHHHFTLRWWWKTVGQDIHSTIKTVALS